MSTEHVRRNAAQIETNRQVHVVFLVSMKFLRDATVIDATLFKESITTALLRKKINFLYSGGVLMLVHSTLFTRAAQTVLIVITYTAFFGPVS